ncbi:MAG: AEC family transporter [Bacillota bacterium]
MVIINALQSVLTVVIVIFLGYILTARKWFDDSTGRLFSKLVVNISLPAMMISNIMTSFKREDLQNAGRGIVIPFISMLIVYIAAAVLSRLFNINKGRRGLFETMFFVSNTIFIGMPVNIALFGEQSVPYVLLYYIANTTLFWTYGIGKIKNDAGHEPDKLFTTSTLKKIMSPPLMGFAAGVVLVLLNVQLPKFIMDSCKYIGNLTTPLSLLFIGITFHSIDLKEIRPSMDMGLLLLGRFVISPLTVYALSLLIPIPVLMTKVFIIQSAMPVIVNAAVTSRAFGADYKFATIMVTVTTIASLLFIPIYMLLLSGL